MYRYGSAKEVIDNFKDSTLIHAMPHTKNARLGVFRKIWGLIFIVGVSGLSYQFYIAFSTYYSYPIQVQTLMQSSRTLVFPSITVCNNNPVKRLNLRCSPYDDLVKVQDKMDTDIQEAKVEKLDQSDSNTQLPDAYTKPFVNDYTCKGSTVIQIPNSRSCSSMTTGINNPLAPLQSDTQSLVAATSNLGSYGNDTLSIVSALSGPQVSSAIVLASSTANLPNAPVSDQLGVASTQLPLLNTQVNGIVSNLSQMSTATFAKAVGLTVGSLTNTSAINSTIANITTGLGPLRGKRSFGPQPISQTQIANVSGDQAAFSLLMNMNMSSGSFFRSLLRTVATQVPDLSNIADMTSIPEQMATDFGYSAEEFIMECSIDNTVCSYKDFQQFYNRRYGNCFTYNSGLGRTPANATRWGSGYGLRLTLNTNISQYIGLLVKDSGVRIAVHQPGTFPFPETTGISAAPGQLTTMAMSMTKVQRLPYPYPSNCRADYPTNYAPFLPPNTSYTQMACQTACLQSAMYTACGCVNILPLNGTYTQCSVYNQTQMMCSTNITQRQYYAETQSGAILCDCSPACDEVKYVLTLSHSQWPNPAYQQLKINNFLVNDPLSAFFLGKYNISGNSDEFCIKEFVPDISVANNLIAFHAFYQDLNYQVIWEQVSYPIDRLFTDIGGIFGLYLGMSLAALFEIVELFVMLIMVACGKRRAKDPDSAQLNSSFRGSPSPQHNMANDIIAYPNIKF